MSFCGTDSLSYLSHALLGPVPKDVLVNSRRALEVSSFDVGESRDKGHFYTTPVTWIRYVGEELSVCIPVKIFFRKTCLL